MIIFYLDFYFTDSSQIWQSTIESSSSNKNPNLPVFGFIDTSFTVLEIDPDLKGFGLLFVRADLDTFFPIHSE
jgi:hypothetical protein